MSSPGESTNTPLAGDQATVTVTLGIPPDDAFAIFTEDINLWWRRGPRFRNLPERNDAGGSGIICMEAGVGGRVFESIGQGADQPDTVVEIGRIKTWDPPRRLQFDWRASNFAPAETTEVEVLFEAVRSGTRVTVNHRGWLMIRADHPVRHGLARAEFIRMMGMWWGDQLTSLRTGILVRPSEI